MDRALSGEQVLGFRVRAQQLDRISGTVDDTAVLDAGVQDTGPDGGRWALALRGLTEVADDALALAWTIRGAPHFYRSAAPPRRSSARYPACAPPTPSPPGSTSSGATCACSGRPRLPT